MGSLGECGVVGHGGVLTGSSPNVELSGSSYIILEGCQGASQRWERVQEKADADSCREKQQVDNKSRWKATFGAHRARPVRCRRRLLRVLSCLPLVIGERRVRGQSCCCNCTVCSHPEYSRVHRTQLTCLLRHSSICCTEAADSDGFRLRCTAAEVMIVFQSVTCLDEPSRYGYSSSASQHYLRDLSESSEVCDLKAFEDHPCMLVLPFPRHGRNLNMFNDHIRSASLSLVRKNTSWCSGLRSTQFIGVAFNIFCIESVAW